MFKPPGRMVRLAQAWMPEWQSSQSPVVAVFTRRKSNKLQKVCVEHAMKVAQIQSGPETNHFCLKYEFPITVLTWIMASRFFVVRDRTCTSVGSLTFHFYDLISSLTLCISWPLADRNARFGSNVYRQVRKPCCTALRLPNAHSSVWHFFTN